MKRLFLLGSLACLTLCGLADGHGFSVEEKTVSQLQQEMQRGSLSSLKLVQTYLSRIRSHDGRLRALISLNPRAEKEATLRDNQRARGKILGPLHGIPVLIKDSIDVKGLPTTGGTTALRNSLAGRNAFIVSRLQKAGAIVLGKTNLDELQTGARGLSSLGGQTLNPYDKRFIPGGSSAGTGVGIAANFATIGIGADTFGSIRTPSSLNALVGLRPTMGLVSRRGSLPGTHVFDVLGPMTRTVEDLALTLDVIAGVDNEDEVTLRGKGKIPRSGFVSMLDRNGLRGTRIGYFREFVRPVGTLSRELRDVLRVNQRMVADFESEGATLVPLTLPPDILDEIVALQQDARSLFGEAGKLWVDYLKSVNGVDFTSLFQILRHEGNRLYQFHGSIESLSFKGGLLLKATQPFDPRLKKAFTSRQWKLQERIAEFLDHENGKALDGIILMSAGKGPRLKPDSYLGYEASPILQTGLPLDDLSLALSSVAGLPTLVIPAGFTRDGFPLAVSFIGRAFSEETLIRLGYAYEQATRHRKPPRLE